MCSAKRSRTLRILSLATLAYGFYREWTGTGIILNRDNRSIFDTTNFIEVLNLKVYVC